MTPMNLMRMLPQLLGSFLGGNSKNDNNNSQYGILGGAMSTLLSTGIAGALGGAIEGVGVGQGLRSAMAGITNSELTGAQREQNQFNADEAQKAREFSEMQRQTQYQTAVADMQAAGLNPAMMYQGAGQASSPTASPQASGNGSPAGNRISDLVSILPVLAQLKLVEAETEKTQSEAKYIDTQTSEMPKLWQSTRELNESQIDNLNQSIAESKSRVMLNGKEMDVKDAQIAVYGSEVTLNEAREAESRAKAWLDSMSAEQVQQLTPVLVELHRANAMLAREQSLTEGERRLYLRAQARCQDALYDVYVAQRGNIVADTALKGASLPGVKAESAIGMYREFEYRNKIRGTRGGSEAAKAYYEPLFQMFGAAGSLLSGVAQIGRNQIMRSWGNEPFSKSFTPSVPGNNFNPYVIPNNKYNF